jgi:NADH-quinone oxidoreductase subunit N
MNAPLIWIFVPAVVAVLLAFIRRWKYIVLILGVLCSLLLAGLAWVVPIGEPWTMGSLTINISETLSILGRQFVIQSSDTPILILIYLSIAFWFGGTIMTNVASLFVPVGLGIASLSTAVFAVEPFLYAALFIELAVLVSVPILVSPGVQVGRGVLRFITFETLGVPFILLTGWLIAGLVASPVDSELILMANFTLGLGFVLMLGIFPFHTWIPMITEESHPYSAAFILFFIPLLVTLFGLGLMDQYIWLRSSSTLYTALRIAGVGMVLVGGVWAAFQRSIGRLIGFAVLIEIGLALLVIGADVDPNLAVPLLGIFFAMLLPWGLSLGIWALAVATILRAKTETNEYGFKLDFREIKGLGWKMPVAAGSLVIAVLSLAGLPFLAGFPPRLALLNGLGPEYLLSSIVVLVGSGGLMVGGVRALIILVNVPEEGEPGPDDNVLRFMETPGEVVLLIIGVIALVFLGLFPHWFTPILAQMTDVYLHLGP